MNKFIINAKLSSCQDMINDLNENIEALNQLIVEFKEYVEKLDFDGDIVSFEYIEKSKVQVEGFHFLIKDRLALFKDPIMKNAMDVTEDEVVDNTVEMLRRELELDVNKFKMLFRLHNLNERAV